MKGANTQGRETCSGPNENFFSLGALEAQGYKFLGMGGTLKVTKGSVTVLKAERAVNLYKVIGSVMIVVTSVATKKEDTTRLGMCVLDTCASEVFKPYTSKEFYQILNTANLTYIVLHYE